MDFFFTMQNNNDNMNTASRTIILYQCYMLKGGWKRKVFINIMFWANLEFARFWNWAAQSWFINVVLISMAVSLSLVSDIWFQEDFQIVIYHRICSWVENHCLSSSMFDRRCAVKHWFVWPGKSGISHPFVHSFLKSFSAGAVCVPDTCD